MKCCYSEKLINKLLILNERAKDKIDMKMVKKAIYFAKKYHGDQKRQSGEAYYTHPIEVAYMLAEYTTLVMPKYFRTDMIVTALLHDTIEDTQLTEENIADAFSTKVASQVQDLTRVKFYGKISAGETVNLLFPQHKDDVLCIKLFDRLHNMSTINTKSSDKIQKIIKETLTYFICIR